MKNKKIILLLIMGSFFIAGNVLAVTCPEAGTWDSTSGVCIPTGTGLPDPGGIDPVETVIYNVMDWMLRIVGVIAIIAFVISGMQYMLAAGDQNMIETAKRNMKWSIVGVIVALIGIVILKTVYTLLD